jgi:RNA polymerase sigma factor (sigma-70 family)
MYHESIQPLAKFAKSLPLLSVEQETELGRAARAGDKGAGQTLANHNLRLVLKLANGHCHNPDQLPDLVSEGMTGLMEAVAKFDPDKGRFSTIATPEIRGRILAFVATTTKQLSVPATTHWRVRAAEGETPDAIAEEIGYDRFTVRAAMGREISTSGPVDSGMDSESTATFGDYLEGDIPDPETAYFNAGGMDHVMGKIQRFRSELSDKERAVLDLLVLESDLSMREVGEQIGASRQAVHQIKGRVLVKLRNRLKVDWERIQAA